MKTLSTSRKSRLALEQLERREVPAGISLNVATGVLRIDGSALGDTASVSLVNGQVKATLTTPPHDGLLGTYFSRTFAPTSVKKVLFYGSDGHDIFTNSTSRPTWAYGEKGNDTLQGGGGADYLEGGDGNDVLWGGGNNDSMHGRIGKDELHGGGGDDWMTGGTGNDTLYGDGDHDTTWGGADDDEMHGGTGNDRVHGQAGKDRLHGDLGNDSLYGEADADALYGDGGTDTLDGGSGKDLLVSIGGGQSDVLKGGLGLDSYWLDLEATEQVADVSLSEVYYGHVHRVGSFYSYYSGGLFPIPSAEIPVSRELVGQDLADPAPLSPEVTSKADFSGNPLFPGAGPGKNDVFQNGLGDCYFASLLASIAKVSPDYIRQMVADLGDGTYVVRFFGYAGNPVYVRVDGDLYTTTGGMVCYGALGPENSLWYAIVEKAWAFFRFRSGSYSSIEGGSAAVDYPELGLGYTRYTTEPLGLNHEVTVPSATDLANTAKAKLAAGKATVLSGPSGFTAATSYAGGRTGEHVYMVEDVYTTAQGTFFKVRNPIGGGYEDIPLALVYARCIEMIVGSLSLPAHS